MGIIDLITNYGTIITVGLVGIGALIFKLRGWWQGKHINGLERTVERQDNAIELHQANENIHKRDDEIDNTADNKIDAVKDQLGKGDEEDAAVVGGALDGFFGGDKK